MTQPPHPSRSHPRNRRLCSSTASLLLLALSSLWAQDGQSSGAQPTSGGEWLQFGGPNGDFSIDSAPLAREWPEPGPPVLWERELGDGYSAVVADSSLVGTFHRSGEEEVVSGLSATTGKTLWTHRYVASPREGNQTEHGAGPHATPLLMNDRVITLGYTGSLRALSRTSGELIWSHELISEYEGEVMNWGYAASPILYAGQVIVLVGGRQAGAMAFDPANGEELWRSPASTVSHATPIIATVEGSDQLLYYSEVALVAVEPRTGVPLWSFPVTNMFDNHSSMPIWGGDGLLWVSTQEDGATRVLRLAGGESPPDIEQLWFNNRVRIHFWNAVRIDNTVYATTGDQVQTMTAVDIRTGTILWRERGFAQANLLRTRSGTLLLDENGELALLDLGPAGMQIRSRATVLNSRVWTPPTLAGTTLYVRGAKRLKALDLSAK